MREGMPVRPRLTHSSTRGDLEAVHAWLAARSETSPLPLNERVARLERQMLTLEQVREAGRAFVTVIRRGKKWAVQVYDPKARARRRWLGTFETEREALDAERAAK